MGHATVNAPYPLRALAWDGSEELFPLARIYDAGGSLITAIELEHFAEGLYGADWTPTVAGHFHVVTVVYSDEDHVTASTDYLREGSEVEVTETLPKQLLEALLSEFRSPGTVGEALSIALGLLLQNYRLDETEYNEKGLMLSGRIRIFGSAADTDAGTNPLFTFLATSVANASPLAFTASLVKVTRVE